MQPDQNHPAATEPSTDTLAQPQSAAGPRDVTAVPPSEAESYLDLARAGRGRGRYYLLGMVIVIFVGTLASNVIWVVADALLPARAPSMTADLIAFLPMFAIVPLVVVLVHRRDWRSVITGRSRLTARNILRPALLFALLLVAISVPACLLDPDGLRFGVPSWSTFAAAAFVAVLLIPFQAGAEELMFRGYLIQWVSLATRRRCVLATISGLCFTLPHLPNPELAELHGPAILVGLLSYFAPGFAWAWVGITTGSIEAAIGAHIANNLVVTIVIGPSNSVLGSTSVITDTSPNLLLTAVSTLVVCLLFARIVTGPSPYWGLARTPQFAAARDDPQSQPALPAPIGS